MVALFSTLLGPSCAIAEETPAVALAPVARTATLAPADRYFGHLQMSVLGMRNAIKDISAYVDGAAGGDVSGLYHKLLFVENALGDLKRQFPQDSWLPKLGLGLAQAFAKMHVADADVHANDALDWVIADYPESDQAGAAAAMRQATVDIAAFDPIPIEPLPAHP